MVKYDYTLLKEHRDSKKMLGRINGFPVYSVSKRDVLQGALTPGYYYVIFDDGSTIIRDGKSIGMLGVTGEIVDWTPTTYKFAVEEKEKEEEEVLAEAMASMDAVAIPLVDAGTKDFFDRIDAEINELLKRDFTF